MAAIIDGEQVQALRKTALVEKGAESEQLGAIYHRGHLNGSLIGILPASYSEKMKMKMKM